jgi:rhamnosyl/mannosyltransferase
MRPTVAEADLSRSAGANSISPRPLRICHLGKYYPPASGGIETHTQTLARAQALLGAHVQVVVVNHAASDGRNVMFGKFQRTPASVCRDGPVQIYRVGRWANLARLDVAPCLPALLRRLLQDPPDVWHLHAPNPAMMLALTALPQVRPLVITHHSDVIRQRVLRHALRPVERLIYRRSSRILPTNPAYASGSELLLEFKDKLEAMPLGLDLTPFLRPSPAALAHAAELRARHSGPIWLSVGRLVYYKGLQVALDALRQVRGTLIVVGTGPMEPEWKRAAEALGVQDRVVWHGPASSEQLIGAYQAATALWFPSIARSEGFGLVQVEAMACGCPVINTAIPDSGVPWVSRHEREGLTVPVNDAPAFAAAANRLAGDECLRQRLSGGGRKRAESEFDWITMGERSLNIYRTHVSVP